MHLQSLLPAALFAVSAIFSASALAAETAADLHSTHAAAVSERSDIASGENASQGASQSSLRIAAAKTGKSSGAARGGETNEAEAILKDSKKDFKVTHKDFADCMKDWGPQTQMTKKQWAASCRSTLQYFPAAP
ncbi:MAG TPA: hypothetical protein VNX29_03500 [Kaistia sp.]|nr:hypothetical protein [Kaistia sp.]